MAIGMYFRSLLRSEVLYLKNHSPLSYVIKIHSELLHVQLTSMKRRVKGKCCNGLEKAKQASAFQCEPVTCQN